MLQFDPIAGATRSYRKLLTPGPVSVHPRVAQALMRSVTLHHRSLEFAGMLAHSMELMRDIFRIPDSHTTVFLPTSGTGMTEAMIRFSLRDGDCLIIRNGEFGSRLVNIARRVGVHCHEVECDSRGHLPLAEIDASLADNRSIRFIYMVHHETSQGHVNDYTDLLKLCEKHDVRLGLDMVSSWGAEAPVPQAPLPDVCVSVSGKAMGAFPGLAFAVIKRDLLEALSWQKRNEHYLGIEHYEAYWRKHGNLPFTPPVQVVASFHQALQEIAAEGLQAKRQRHERCIKMISNCLQGHGYEVIHASSPSITTRTFRYLEEQVESFDHFHRVCGNAGFLLLQNPVTQRPHRIFQASSMGYILPEELQDFIDITDAGHGPMFSARLLSNCLTAIEG